MTTESIVPDDVLHLTAVSYVPIQHKHQEYLTPSLVGFAPFRNFDILAGTSTELVVEDISTDFNIVRFFCSQEGTDELYAITVPPSLLGLFTMLAVTPDPIDFYLYEDEHADIIFGYGKKLKRSDALFTVKLPHPDEELFSQILAAIIPSIGLTRSYPLNSSVQKVLSSVSLTAREVIFPILARLALGKVNTYYELRDVCKLIHNLDERSQGLTTQLPRSDMMLGPDLEKHDEVLLHITTDLKNALNMSDKTQQSISEAYYATRGNHSQEDMQFLRIMSEQGILDKLNKIGGEENHVYPISTASPFSPDWPEQMQEIKEALDNDEELGDDVLTFLERGHVEDDSFSVVTRTIGIACILAARAGRFMDFLDVDDRLATGMNEESITAVWLNNEEENSWEIPAFTNDLLHYDTEAFASLISSSVTADTSIDTLFWFVSVSAGLLLHFGDQSIEPQEVFDYISQSDLRPKNMEMFMATVGTLIVSWMEDLHEMEEETGEDTIVLDKDDLIDYSTEYFREFFAVNEDISVYEVSKNFGLLIALLADRKAENHPIGSEEWKTERKDYIYSLLELCSCRRTFIPRN